MGPNLHLKKKFRHVEKQIKPQYNILSDFKKKISQILKANFFIFFKWHGKYYSKFYFIIKKMHACCL